MKQIFQIIAEIGKVETMDSGMKLVVYTNECSQEDMAVLMGLKSKQGNFLFAPLEHDFVEDIKNLPEVSLEQGEKHPSVRMRAIIFRLWEQTGGVNRPDKKTSEQYYKEQMERLNNALKEKLA